MTIIESVISSPKYYYEYFTLDIFIQGVPFQVSHAIISQIIRCFKKYFKYDLLCF